MVAERNTACIPLTLFADACNADALEALDFNRCENYLANKSKENKAVVTDFSRSGLP
jgi:hexosaminidase